MSIGDQIVSDLSSISSSVKSSPLGANRANDIIASNIMGASKGGNVLNQNYNFESGGVGWISTTGVPVYSIITDGALGSGTVQESGYNKLSLTSKDFLPIDNNRLYNISAYLRRISGTNAGNVCFVGVNFYTSTKTLVATNWYAANGVTPSTSWTQYSVAFGSGTSNSFPTNAVYMQAYVILNYGNGDITIAPFSIPGYISDYAYQAQSIRIDEYSQLFTSNRIIEVNNSGYTILDNDYVGTIVANVGAGNGQIFTLPTGIINNGRIITLIKSDIGVAFDTAQLTPQVPDTIGPIPLPVLGAPFELYTKGDYVTVQYDFANHIWWVIATNGPETSLFNYGTLTSTGIGWRSLSSAQFISVDPGIHDVSYHAYGEPQNNPGFFSISVSPNLFVPANQDTDIQSTVELVGAVGTAIVVTLMNSKRYYQDNYTIRELVVAGAGGVILVGIPAQNTASLYLKARRIG